MMNPGEDDFGKGFFSDVLHHIAATCKSRDEEIPPDDQFTTYRDLFHGTREDVSTESGIAISDESSLLTEARPSPVDMGKQKEIVATLIKFMQVLKLNYNPPCYPNQPLKCVTYNLAPLYLSVTFRAC